MKYTYESVKQDFEDHGLTLVSTSYKNTKTDLEYACNKHKDKGVQKIKYGNYLRGRTCPYCMYERGTPPQHLPDDIYKNVTESLGYTFVQKEHKNSTTLIHFICNKHPEAGIQTAW